MSVGEVATKPQPRPDTPPPSVVPFRDFFSLDIRSLAVFRIALALVLIADWLDRLPDLYTLYSDHGIVPREAITGLVPISVHFYSGEVWYQGVLVGIALLFAFGLLIGYKTAFVTIVSWFLIVSVHGRNPSILHGGDQVIRLVLFWSLFLPLGACYSLDAADPRRRPASPRVLSPGSVGLILQIVLIYWFAGAWKWAPEWRTEGTAVHHALQIGHFSSRIGQWLTAYPGICRILTFSTIYLELVGPVLLFVPFYPALLRLVLVGTFILFHAGLALTMELGIFPWACCVAWLPLLPTAFWDRILNQLRTPEHTGLVLLYDPSDAGGWRAVTLLRTFLALPHARLEPASEQGGQVNRVRQSGASRYPGWAVLDYQKRELFGPEALAYLVKLSPLLGGWASWLLVRPPFRWLGEGVLFLLPGWFNRQAGIPAPPPVTGRPAWTPAGGVIGNTIAIFCLIYIILLNVRTIDHARNSWIFPRQMLTLGSAVGLDQGWGLFAPWPLKEHGWIQVIGHQKDGKRVDVLKGGAPSDDRPELISALYPNARWRKLIMTLSTSEAYPFLLPGYTKFAFVEWNRTHAGDEQLSLLEVIWWKEQSVPPGAPRAAAEKVLLGTYR